MAVVNESLMQLSEEQRGQVASWLVEFDQGWEDGRLAAKIHALPPPEDPRRRAALIELVKIDLERQWERGRRPSIEAYLHFYPELGTKDSIPADLVQAEYEVRLQFGAPADLADFARRFPSKIEELQQLLEQARRLVSDAELADPGRQTAVTGPATPSNSNPSTSAAKDEVRLPEQFGRYRILKELGKGGMGAVYLAHDTQLDRKVALKVPHFKPDAGPQVYERFFREARAAAAFDHPNLCPIHEVGQIDGIHYLTMPFIEGQPLSAFIKSNQGLPQRSVAFLVRKLALAMQEAHGKGVIHRDLKPANIMIRPPPSPPYQGGGQGG